MSGSGLEFKTRIGILRVETVDSGKVLDEWKRRAAQFSQTGRWPLILGLEDDLGEFGVGVAEDGDTPAGHLRTALETDVVEFFANRREEFEEDGANEGETDEVDVNSLDLRKPGSKNLTTIEGVLQMAPYKAVGMIEVPCQEPWQVFTVCPFGGWNEVPTDAELTAVFRHWYEKAGALPIGMTRDVIELWLDKPITDPGLAAEIAMEMYTVAPDVVWQGTQSVHDLAQCLLNASVWFLWWD